jgi:hypothetical protein
MSNPEIEDIDKVEDEEDEENKHANVVIGEIRNRGNQMESLSNSDNNRNFMIVII